MTGGGLVVIELPPPPQPLSARNIAIEANPIRQPNADRDCICAVCSVFNQAANSRHASKDKIKISGRVRAGIFRSPGSRNAALPDVETLTVNEAAVPLLTIKLDGTLQ